MYRNNDSLLEKLHTENGNLKYECEFLTAEIQRREWIATALGFVMGSIIGVGLMYAWHLEHPLTDPVAESVPLPLPGLWFGDDKCMRYIDSYGHVSMMGCDK